MASTLGGGAPPRGRLWSKAPPLGHPIRPPGRACGRFQASAVCAQPVRLRRPGFYRKSRRQARTRPTARPVVGRWGASGASGGPCCIAALPVVLGASAGLQRGLLRARRGGCGGAPRLPYHTRRPRRKGRDERRGGRRPCAAPAGVVCLACPARSACPGGAPHPRQVPPLLRKRGRERPRRGVAPVAAFLGVAMRPRLLGVLSLPSRNTSAAVPCWGPLYPPPVPPRPLGGQGGKRGVNRPDCNKRTICAILPAAAGTAARLA